MDQGDNREVRVRIDGSGLEQLREQAKPPGSASRTGYQQTAGAGQTDTSPTNSTTQGLKGCSEWDDDNRMLAGLGCGWLGCIAFPLTLLVDIFVLFKIRKPRNRWIYVALSAWLLVPLFSALAAWAAFLRGTAMLDAGAPCTADMIGDLDRHTHARVHPGGDMPPPLLFWVASAVNNSVVSSMAERFGTMKNLGDVELPSWPHASQALEEGQSYPDLEAALQAATHLHGMPRSGSMDLGRLSLLQRLEAPSVIQYRADPEAPWQLAETSGNVLLISSACLESYNWGRTFSGGVREVDNLACLFNMETGELLTQFVYSGSRPSWEEPQEQAAEPEMSYEMQQWIAERGLEVQDEPRTEVALSAEACLALLEGAREFTDPDAAVAWLKSEHGMREPRLGFTEPLQLMSLKASDGTFTHYRPQLDARWRVAFSDGIILFAVPCESSRNEGWSYEPVAGKLMLSQLDLETRRLIRQQLLAWD